MRIAQGVSPGSDTRIRPKPQRGDTGLRVPPRWGLGLLSTHPGLTPWAILIPPRWGEEGQSNSKFNRFSPSLMVTVSGVVSGFAYLAGSLFTTSASPPS